MIPNEIANAAACEEDGDKELVMEWLDNNPERVNDVSAAGATLLVLCLEDREATEDHLELVRYLISRGADPNRICRCAVGNGFFENMSAVHQAAGGKNSPLTQEVLACLLKAGADPNLVIQIVPGGQRNVKPLAGAINTFLASHTCPWQLPVIARLLKAGASLDDCYNDRTADELIADEERQWARLIVPSFQAAAILIRGVRAAGSWKKYCRRWGPHRQILALRSLAMRGYITPYQRRRTRSGARGAEYKTAVAFLARLGDNGIVWNILSFWRDPDDVEEVAVPDNDGVRVVRVYN